MGSLSGSCTAPPRSYRAPPGRRIGIPLEVYPELEAPGGTIRVLTERHGPLYVRRTAEARFAAISAICTHRGCTVKTSPRGFRCPCHGSTYDAAGRRTGGPAARDLPRFSVERDGDELVVSLDQLEETGP